MAVSVFAGWVFTLALFACKKDEAPLEDDEGISRDDTATSEDDTGVEQVDDDTGDVPGDDTGPVEPDPVPADGTISGHVYVELYYLDEDGLRKSTTFEEAYGGEFPFGAIYVAAYGTDDDGVMTYAGDTHVPSPSTSGDAYEMDVHLDDKDDINVYAILDYGRDGILQSYDPIGVHADVIVFDDGLDADDVDIYIVVPADSSLFNNGGGGTGGGSGGGGTGGGSGGGGTGGGSGGGSGSGTGCTDISINGPLTIKMDYKIGDAIAMIADLDGGGPWDWDWTTPTPSKDGAKGDYEILTCTEWGEMNLLGAWDSNNNNLIDPTDEWGAYVTAPDTSGNPIVIENDDLDDYEIQIPLSDLDGDGVDDMVDTSSGISVVPWVQLTGTVSVLDATFDDLPTGSIVYVAALKYRPNSDLSVSTLEAEAYDLTYWEWPDLTGETSKDFVLGVPTNTTMYLWAYVDEDGDGIVNESGEAIASGGVDDDGTLDSGTETSNYEMPLSWAESR